MAGKLLAGVAKDIDLVATGGKLAEKMDDKKKGDDGGSFWQDRQRHFFTKRYKYSWPSTFFWSFELQDSRLISR